MQALYYPPQKLKPDGVQLSRNSTEKYVVQIAAACGLEPVGWVITTLPRSGEQYGGDMLMSGAEIRQAARFQDKWAKDDHGHSKFVTMIIQRNIYVYIYTGIQYGNNVYLDIYTV